MDDTAISRLEAVHGRDSTGDAELVARVAGPAAGRLAREALDSGLSLHQIVDGGQPAGWPDDTRRRLDAAVALVRRADRSRPAPRRFHGPRTIADYIHRHHLPLAVEQFGLLLLSARHALLRDVVVSIGTVSEAPIDTKRMARQIASLPTAAIATWHNHPSGDPRPSECDIAIWRQIDQVAKLFGTTTLDHLIVTRPGGPWYSNKTEHGYGVREEVAEPTDADRRALRLLHDELR